MNHVSKLLDVAERALSAMKLCEVTLDEIEFMLQQKVRQESEKAKLAFNQKLDKYRDVLNAAFANFTKNFHPLGGDQGVMKQNPMFFSSSWGGIDAFWCFSMFVLLFVRDLSVNFLRFFCDF